jgi:hypothetical protein
MIGYWAAVIKDSGDIMGITSKKFWMHKLFNKVYGYMTRNGFADIWDEYF